MINTVTATLQQANSKLQKQSIFGGDGGVEIFYTKSYRILLRNAIKFLLRSPEA